jgi:hypothetical protein
MKQAIHTLKTAILGIMFSAAAFHAQADSYEDGLIAYTNGNFAEAGQHLMNAANDGSSGAEQMLMRMFSEGHLTVQNQEQEILKWTRKAAEKGIKQAQFALGELYATKPEKMIEAVKWYRMAADQGHPDAYYRLGDILKTGARGIDANAAESNRMYQIAASEFNVFAQMGNPDYQYHLGTMFQHAKGVEKDIAAALKWMSKSALQGHTLAQLALGRIYAKGSEVPRDDQKARYWLNLAAAQGHDDAITALDELDKESKVALAM